MKVLATGKGPLFSDPDPDRARAFFATKSRALIDKETTIEDAVARFVYDGDYLAVGGFGAVRVPMAGVFEIVRQGRKHMVFAGHTSTFDCMILAAGEVFDRCDIAYVIGLEARGLSRTSRRYFESGKVRICEWTNFGMTCRLTAAADGVPFALSRTTLGTDTFARSAARIVECPFTGKPFVAFPALYPDVSIIHVHEADKHGNCYSRGINVADDFLARASRRVIVTAERIVDTEVFRRDPNRTHIPYFCVDAVVEVPYGSYPGNMPFSYYSDEAHIRSWLDAENEEGGIERFLQRYVLDPRDFSEYLALCGGTKRMAALERLERLTGQAPGG
jgi:glutaconate CoA-transferase subunit A